MWDCLYRQNEIVLLIQCIHFRLFINESDSTKKHTGLRKSLWLWLIRSSTSTWFHGSTNRPLLFHLAYGRSSPLLLVLVHKANPAVMSVGLQIRPNSSNTRMSWLTSSPYFGQYFTIFSPAPLTNGGALYSCNLFVGPDWNLDSCSLLVARHLA